MVNEKQMIWAFGVPILFNLYVIHYAITTGYEKPASLLGVILFFMILFVPLYFLRDKK